MNRFLLAAIVGAAFASCAHAQTLEPLSSPANPRSEVASVAPDIDKKPSAEVIQTIADRVKPALVRIHVVSSDAEGGREQRSESFGSGAIISPDGYVVTNHHVAGEALWLSVTLANRKEVSARLIGTDPLSDIAVIKLDASHAPYPTAKWGDSSTLRVGDSVLAMGSPLALSQSVTAGIVANTELVLPNQDSEFNLDGENVGSIVRWIGHDALIQPGNSGGPLVNLNGEIIGINEVNLGLSGAIPGNLAREVAMQLIEKGQVDRAFTGLDLQPRLKTDKREVGVLVGGVWPDSPAQKAGIKPGDLLVSANGELLNAEFPEQLPIVNLQLARLPRNKAATFVVQRGDQTMSIPVTPTLRGRNLETPREVKGWGLAGSDISEVMSKEYSLSSTKGVMVWSVQDGGPAGSAKPALEEADVIVAVDRKPVTNLASLREVTAKIPRSEEGTPTLVEVLRSGERVLLVVNLNSDPSDDTSSEVAKAYLPVSTQVVTPQLAQALKLPAGTEGVRITMVHPGSIAEKAGFKVGDIITRLDDDKVEASQPEDDEVFEAMIRQYKIGSKAKVRLLRNGKATVIPVTLTRAPKQERELAVYRDDNFGVSLRDVTYDDRLRGEAAKNAQGALVTNVQSGSWASLAGLQANDIVSAVDGVKVANMAAARDVLRQVEKQKKRTVVFFVTRGVRTLYAEAQTDWVVEENATGAAQ